ncbi:MAG: hypothetical protein M1327_07310 [Candidatus Thermoplasmatota archaeon]|nr:hypothetical protein [Candidatus Thermoplasmatota archaeon]
MNKKSLVLLVIIILLLGWLVASSVTTFQELAVGKTQSTSPGGKGTGSTTGGSGPGSGSGSGGGGGGGFGFSGLSFNGFPFSLNFSGIFHFPSLNFPHFNISYNFSNFRFPFNLSSLGSLFGLGSGKGGNSGNGGSGGPGGPGGSSGNTGKGGTGQGKGGQVNPILPIILNPIILIIIVAIVSVVLAFTVVNQARKNRDASSRKEDQEEILEAVIVPEQVKDATMSREELMDLQHGEVIAGISGWKSIRGLLHPPIPSDLPLIWQKSDTLNMKVEEGSYLTLPAGLKQNAEGVYALRLQERCNLVKAVSEDEEDSLLIRAIDYSEDVRRFFLLNFVNYNTQAQPSMTAREIIAKMKPIGSISGTSSYDEIVSAYERSFYGYKKIRRDDFENFLRGLSKLDDPKIIICAGN